MRHFDAIVVGAGIVGAHFAHLAAKCGRKVAIIEPEVVGGGVTAASMGHLVAMDDDPAELALGQYSLALWEQYQHVAEAEFSRCGTLWVAATERELQAIPAKMERLDRVGIRVEAVDAQGLRGLEPGLAKDLLGGMLVPDEAVVYPPRICDWLVRQAIAHGACLLQGRRVLRLGDESVELDDGSVLAGIVVVAAGNASAALLPELPMHRRRGHLVITDRYPGTLRHQVLELGYADSAHGSHDVSVAFNVQPRPTGQLLLGSSREQGQADDRLNPDVLRKMLERAFRYLPGSASLKAIRVWTGQRPCTTDGRPYIGAVPGRRGTWVASGHEGLGVATSTGTAQLLLDLIDGKAPAIDPAPYDPARAIAWA